MSPMPHYLIDRWQDRDEPSASDEILYWHILMKDNPAVQQMASVGRSRLASQPGLHFPPQQWLHMTTYIAGSLARFGEGGIQAMLKSATLLLAQSSPVTVRLGKLFYHPEAIVLVAQPPEALGFVYTAVRQATHCAQGSGPMPDDDSPWSPHVTLAYSTADQPAAPIIKALGRTLPECEVTIDRVSLVVQKGAERLWHWRSVGEVRFGTSGSARD